MNKTIVTLTLALIGLSTSFAQVGIGTPDPDASAILEIDSPDKGFLPPRMDEVARDAINEPDGPAEGLVIFNIDINCLEFYNGTDWINMCAGGSTEPTPVYCDGSPTTVVQITSFAGRIWMDRNLGAANAANDFEDTANGLGDFYQWGRFSDGHQCLTAGTYNIDDADKNKATTAEPFTGADWDGLFIIDGPPSQTSPVDWLATRNDNLWQGVDGVNNPCPSGYRLPTTAEYQAEIDALGTAAGSPNFATAAGMFDNIKMVTTATGHGERLSSSGALSGSFNTVHWTSTVSASNPGLSNMFQISFGATGSLNNASESQRAIGMQVRCIQD